MLANGYFFIAYCTFYLTKVIKSITQEMQFMSNKCKHEQYETSKQIKKLENQFLNAQLMFIQQAVNISLSNENNSGNHINSILKTILKNMLKYYLTILIEDFNINMFLKKHLIQQHFKTLCTNTN
jgi:hypothetical protein